MGEFYVYAHYVPGADRPFYVGKGRKHRPRSRTRRSEWWKRHVELHCPAGPDVRILACAQSEEDAFALERFWIALFGRRKLYPTGSLLNMTDGGEGVSGYRHDARSLAAMRAGREHAGGYKRGHKLSEEACRRIAAGCVGRVHPPRSAEHNAKLAAAKRGKKAGPQAEERRKKIAEAKGATLVRLRHTSGTEYDVVNRTEFMRQSGIRCREMLLRLLTGKIPEYRGYVVTHAG